MPTDSKTAFDTNVQRARYFLEIHEESQEGAGAPPLRYRELCRAAIVFAVGAVDAYLSEVSAEVIIRDLQAGVASNDIRKTLKLVQADLPTLALEVAVLGTNPQRIERIREAIADHFHNKTSNHGSKAVASTMSRMGRQASDVWSYLSQGGYQNPANRLDLWTKRRHEIVHQGQRPMVRRSAAASFLEFLETLVGRIDELAENP